MEKMNPELKEKWVAALRSGKYAQGKYKYRQNDNFCCLGVLADCIDPNKWKIFPHLEGSGVYVGRAIEVHRFLDENEIYTLVKMNDKLGKSFSEIADYIEQNL